MLAIVRRQAERLAAMHPDQQTGARNLLQYLAFRSHDVRPLQDRLHELGLSSLASAESHICCQLEHVLRWLRWRGKPQAGCTSEDGKRNLARHVSRLFGALPSGSLKHVMVTLDASVGDDSKRLADALKRGMTIARINCAHDDEAAWLRWLANLHAASKRTGIHCKIYMDLPGPKMRMQLLAGANAKGRIRIAVGDRIRLIEAGEPVPPDANVICCQEHGVVAQLRAGDRVVIDDGKHSGEIVLLRRQHWIRITSVSGKKPRLENEKGINFPRVDLRLPILSAADAALLPFIAAHADLMGCSFVRSAADVKALREALAVFARRPALILKIETPQAVLHLPDLLLEAMQDAVCGVMIARGDLAVELGFTSLSDVQDKILWIGEAAHVPVIWATQVLESLQKTGRASRSEITDAAHAFKAECVMLNKGEYLPETLTALSDILQRTDAHRSKKRYNLRPLTVACEFVGGLKANPAQGARR